MKNILLTARECDGGLVKGSYSSWGGSVEGRGLEALSRGNRRVRGKVFHASLRVEA